MTKRKRAGSNITWFYLLFFFLSTVHTSSAQNAAIDTVKLSTAFKGISLEAALTKLVVDGKMPISFDPSLLPAKQITKSFTKVPLAGILDFLFSGTDLTYQVTGPEIVIIQKKVKRFTVSGHILDAENGEEIIGAVMFITSLNQGVSSNNYGFYSLTVPQGKYEILITHVGYNPKKITISSDRSVTGNFKLEKEVHTLKEVVVNSEQDHSGVSQVPGKALPIGSVKDLPYYGGEFDLVKALQMQSGILAITEGSSNLFVRGGNKDQNLILLDEAVVYNPSHLFGLVSVFNPDAMKNIQVYKDEIPANFGGRLSSVIDSRMAEGDDKMLHIKGGMSLLSARVAAEGPILQDKGSFLFAFRRGLYDVFDNSFKPFNLDAVYYDYNLKSNYKLNTNNRIFLSAYLGSDYLSSANSFVNKWGNKTATFRWNHLFNPKLFFNLSAIYSNYKNQLDINSGKALDKYKWQTGIQDISLKSDFTYYNRPGNEIKFGFNGTYHFFAPGETSYYNGAFNIPRSQALENAVYFSQSLNINEKLKVSYGLRASLFINLETNKLFLINNQYQNIGEESNLKGGYNTFFKLEPRITMQYRIDNLQQVYTTYTRNYQYLQLVQNDELAFSSLETWIPASPNVKPQQADSWSAGYQANLDPIIFTLDGYYKKLNNQLDLIDHAQVILNPVIESQLRSGRSNAYGLEFALTKNTGKLTGNLSYTYSRVFRKIAGINNGNTYPANYDIPHDIKLTANYQLAKRVVLSSFFTFASGRPVTLPVGYFLQNNIRVPIFEDRNASRFPNYQRLDINATWTPKPSIKNHRQWKSSWSIGIYNLSNQKNPLFYGLNQNSPIDNLGYTEFFSGILPTVSYNFKF